MVTWAIGDVQGCATTLERLMARINFTPGRDRALFCGDLVNRGAQSLAALRLVRSLGESAVCVLGNHDLHLLGRALAASPAKPTDTLDDVLRAPDRDELLAWLLGCPLLHRERDGTVLVHAGLHPSWDVAHAERTAREAEESLRDDAPGFLEAVAQDAPGPVAQATRVLTRIRTVKEDGALCPFGGPPLGAPLGCTPWFSAKGRKSAGTPILFGHWSALGLHLAEDVSGLDTGCVWGGTLTALRLEDRAFEQEPQAREDRA